jgi:hypothetical protein
VTAATVERELAAVYADEPHSGLHHAYSALSCPELEEELAAAVDEAGAGEFAVVHVRSDGDPMVAMRLKDYLAVYALATSWTRWTT